MTFYGQEPPPPAEKPIRTFFYKDGEGQRHEIAASYVQFMPDHVTFWQETGQEWDVLVLAEQNQNVTDLKETK